MSDAEDEKIIVAIDKMYDEIMSGLLPCEELNYCPYGCLVEYFPLEGETVQWNGLQLPWIKPRKEAKSCPVFGHDCPFFYVPEPVYEKVMNCEACNEKIEKNITDILKTGDATYKLCPNCLPDLVNTCLSKKQFKNLLENGHNAGEFYLHGDFYDSEGNALQPR